MYDCNSLKRENESLRWELEEQRERQERERENHQRRERERREERQREYNESLCYAETWEEAFSKGIPRIRSEAADEQSWNSDEEAVKEWGAQNFFGKYLAEVERAQALYSEEMKASEVRIKELEQLIQAEKQSALNRVADRLDEEFPNNGTSEAFRENNPEFLTNW